MPDLSNYDVLILDLNPAEYREPYTAGWILTNQVIFDIKTVINSNYVLSL